MRGRLDDDHPVRSLPRLRAVGSPLTDAFAAEVVEGLLADSSPVARGFILVGLGETVVAAARRTGVSRQQLYRAVERLRDG